MTISVELKQLCIDPSSRGRGLAARFMAVAKQQQPDGLTLWTFQVNTSARRFYQRHGVTAVEQGDGRRNDEREPDSRFVRQPRPRPS
ncbi:GNAT family N-acetyltransferase [Streptomyces sp. NPDC096136]|uniref:GNAT family N-acetyltransferase n=1 Tax=Streptomyces sp. NPDC096136 TaxID=3366076 RepID=UPI0037FD3811